jgi:hypothetical protein
MGENLTDVNPEELSWVPRLVFEYPTAGLVIYLAIVILSIIVYNLGFARKLPLLKTVIVYIALLVGCLVITMLALMGAPILEVLLIASLFLVVYKIRLNQRKSEES